MTVQLACVAELEAVLASLESEVGDVADPGTLVDALVPLERRLAAVRGSLAARAAEQKVHRRHGYKDEADWLARTTGVSKRVAKDQLDTQKRLEDLPVLRDAQRKGQLSEQQAVLVARAGAADPSRQQQLLGAAKREDLKGLRATCDRVIAGADRDAAAAHARIRKNRSLRFWRQADGTHCLTAKGTAEDMAIIKSRITRRADVIFDTARKAGRRESFEAYRFDALVALASAEAGEGGEQEGVIAPKRDLLIHIDHSAARRGHAVGGERCEIDGVGPIPVDVALDFDADPFIKAVIRDGTDIRTVVHYGRHVPAELRTALEARGMTCCVPGCSNDAHLQIDHALVDHADGGPLALWNTQWLCRRHHRRKTNGQLHIDLPPPTPAPPPTRGPGRVGGPALAPTAPMPGDETDARSLPLLE